MSDIDKEQEVVDNTPVTLGENRNEKGQFLPGHTGNPLGRPLGIFSFKDEWRKLWTENPEEFVELAKEWLKDKSLRALIIQQIDGRPKESIAMEHSGSMEQADPNENDEDKKERLAIKEEARLKLIELNKRSIKNKALNEYKESVSANLGANPESGTETKS